MLPKISTLPKRTLVPTDLVPPKPPFLASQTPVISASLPSSCIPSASEPRETSELCLNCGLAHCTLSMCSGLASSFFLLPALPQACHLHLLLIRIHYLCLIKQVRESIKMALCILVAICRPYRVRNTVLKSKYCPCLQNQGLRCGIPWNYTESGYRISIPLTSIFFRDI